MELMNKVKFINSYSYIFNPRPGTPEFHMKGIEKDLAKERLFTFQNLSKKIKTEYRKTLFKKTMSVLFENKTKNDNQYFGRDEYYNSVIVKSNQDLSGKIKNVKITKVSQNTLFGEVVQKLIHKEFAA